MVDKNKWMRGAPSERSRRALILILSAVLSVWCIARLPAETVVSTELGLNATMLRSRDGDTSLSSVSSGKLILDSRGSQEVKGQLVLALTVADTVVLDVSKVYLKARLGDLRLTTGKTRLSWGEGVMFNSGDVLFGTGGVDLSAEDLRDDTKWLLSLYLPLGDYSFIESVVLPPNLPISDYLNKALRPNDPTVKVPEIPPPEKSSYGGRVYGKAGDIKIEGGYLYDGGDSRHKPYLSFQGNLLADWHLSSSVALDSGDPFNWGNMQTWEISTGLYYQLPLTTDTGDTELTETPSSGDLNFRIEGRVRPFGRWTTYALPPVGFNPQSPTGSGSPYALSLYPEISWKNDNWFVYARSIISPLDTSALTTVGAQWSPLQGFKMLLGLTWHMGEKGDAYSWEREGGWQITLGTKLSF